MFIRLMLINGQEGLDEQEQGKKLLHPALFMYNESVIFIVDRYVLNN